MTRPGLLTEAATLAGGPAALASLGDRARPSFWGLKAPESSFEPLVRELRRQAQERPIRVLFAPCPEPTLRAGQRPPTLAAVERDERTAAVRLVTETITRARDLGAEVVVLPSPGRVLIPSRRNELAALFAIGWLDAGEPGTDRLASWREERARAAQRAVDALRSSLDRLAEEADRHGVRVGLPNARHYDELPTRDEALRLLGELRGAPIGLWLDTAAAHAKEVLGLGTQAGFLRELGGASARPGAAVRILGASLSDAAGLRGGLAPGRGEIDFSEVASLLPADCLRLVACGPDMRADEVASALDLVERIAPPPGTQRVA